MTRSVLNHKVFQLAEAGDAENLLDDLRYRALTNLYYFAKVVLGYKELSARLHLEWCEWLQSTFFLRNRGSLIPRGHFKSTIVSKSYPLWRLLKIEDSLVEKYPDLEEYRAYHDPNTRVLIVGESGDVGNKNLKDMKWNLLHNQLLQALFPSLIPPDINDTKWTDDEVLLPRPRSFDESSITTIGVGAKTTGKHFDLIIYDDLFGEKAAKSEAEAESVKHWFKFAPGLANNPATVEELFIGTRWKAGTGDIYGHVMATLPSEEDEIATQSNSVDSEGGRTGGFVWYVRSAIEPDPTTGEPTPIFPERFSFSTLAAIRKREGEYAFSCNYLNNPVAEGLSDFDLKWLREYQVAEDGKTLSFSDGSPAVLLGKLTRISFYDPSSGGKSAQCEAAITAVGADSLYRKILLDEWSANTTYGKAACRWMQMNDRFIFAKNYYEKVGGQKSIEDVVFLLNTILRSGKKCPHCGAAHRPLRIEGVTPPGGSAEKSKDDRIRMFLQETAEAGRLYVRWNSHRKFRTQYSEFPHGDLKDVLDSAAYAVHLSPTPRSWEEIESEKAEAVNQRALSRPYSHTTVDYGGYR
jgi:hypothetical protein